MKNRLSSVTIYCMISTDRKNDKQLTEKIKKLSGVREAKQVLGEYEIMAILEDKRFDGIALTAVQKLRSIPGILAVKEAVCP